MKAWLHNRRMRKRHSEANMLGQRLQSTERGKVTSRPPRIPTIVDEKGLVRIAPGMISRMSIERYLSAPLSDEAASAPAINAALRKKVPHERMDSASNMYISRDTSMDVHSEGRRTFYTTASVPDTVDTLYTIDSKSKPQRIVVPNSPVVHGNAQWMHSDRTGNNSPDRPLTSGTIWPVDMAKEWAESIQKFMPGYSPDSNINYRARAEEEIMMIQEKAKELEFLMRQFKLERDAQGPVTSRITDESAQAIIASNPKLAWILGGDPTDVASIPRPRTVFSPTNDGSSRPSTAGSNHELPHGRLPRKSKSNSALDEEARQTPPIPRLDGNVTPPVKRLRFYCTFCQKRFHSQAEWLRHERTIHIPEELWICCPRTGAFPTRCPFCEKMHPSPAHLADHNYLSCQEKPLSERTFGRKDHFLLHISQVHKVSPGQKPARLTELENAWRQPLPMKLGHQALHCGFCGSKFSTYQERTAHVGQHFAEGTDMMSWWKDRVSHDEVFDVEEKTVYPDMPHSCAYCGRTFETLAKARKLHPVCSMWSCSFLPGIQYTIYPTGSQRKPAAVCCYCNDPLAQGPEGKVNGTILKEHMVQHNFRACSQRLYFCGQTFRQHLQDNHRISYDSTLFAGWTLLLKSSRKQKPSIFRQTEVQQQPIRRATTDPITAPPKNRKKHSTTFERVQPTPTNFMELTELPQRTEPNKLRRKQSTVTIPPEEELRASTHFFTRAATADFAGGPSALPSPGLGGIATTAASPDLSAGTSTPARSPSHIPPTFYRRRLDASTRNRLYVRDDDGDEAGGAERQLFRRIPGSVMGGLVLHSSLVAGVPARLTNSVDVYALG